MRITALPKMRKFSILTRTVNMDKRNVYWPRFEENHADTPVMLVLFTQDECPPCEKQDQILEKVIAKVDPEGVVEFYYSDTLLTPREVVETYHLHGVPSIAVFEKGRLSELVVGVQSEQYTEMLYSKWVDRFKEKYG